VLVYVPGIEFTGYTLSKQLERLSAEYDVRIFRLSPSDRTPAVELHGFVQAEVRSLEATGRRVVLMGESFGGVVALDAALRMAEGGRAVPFSALVLINAATVISSTPWPTLASALEALPKGVYQGLPSLLSPALVSGAGAPGSGDGAGGAQQAQSVDPADAAAAAAAAASESRSALSRLRSVLPGTPPAAPPPSSVASIAARVGELVPALKELPRALPRETLAFRLRQLDAVATKVMDRDWSSARVPTLVLASSRDTVIPSTRGAREIESRLLGARVRTLHGSAHAPLIEAGVDLGTIFREEGVLTMPRPRARDHVEDWVLPSRDDMTKAAEVLRPVRRLTSPRFFSTGPSGQRWPGLAGLPAPRDEAGRRRPILFVGNHQLMGFTDLPVLVEELAVRHGVLVRGLAHPATMKRSAAGKPLREAAWERRQREALERRERGVATPPSSGPGPRWSETVAATLRPTGVLGPGKDSGLSNLLDFEKFGAVPVSGRNLYRLLARNESALLYPGGIREAFKRKHEDYQLFWPDAAKGSDFVRIAARHGAMIVPVASVGAEEGYSVLLDTADLLNLPGGLGERVRRSAAGVPRGRVNETFVAPVALPRLPPPRYYFCFGQPVDTRTLDIEDHEAAKQVYRSVRTDIEDSIAWLLERRETDPYKDFGPRFVYEVATNWTRQAPTFDLSQ